MHPRHRSYKKDYDKIFSTSEMNEQLREHYPHVRYRSHDVHLPRRWDINQSSTYLELSKNGLQVSFKSVPLQGDKDISGVIRSDCCIPACFGTYYFEVTILHCEGKNGCMGVGLSKANGDLTRMPGWDPHCYGYHGDDGNFFNACGHGKSYGPRFGKHDVIGCGIDTNLNIVFFTKDGQLLGIAHEGKPGEMENLYPTVGLRTPGEKLYANFGQYPFKFDLDDYRQILNNRKVRMIENIKVPSNFGKHMERVVASFLGSCGALETLKVFEKQANLKKAVDYEFLRKRKEISQMVVRATNGAGIQEKLEEYFPGCLENEHKVQLLLLCLRYIDLALTIENVPASFGAIKDGPSTSKPASPPKPKKGPSNSGKSGKRNKKGQQKYVDAKTEEQLNEETLLNLSKIDKIYNDEDTGEQMLEADGFPISRRMYVELYASGEFQKLTYIMRLGREIDRIALAVEDELSNKDRQILEDSLLSIVRLNPPGKYPLKAKDRRYISNCIVEMINNYKDPNVFEEQEVEEEMEPEPVEEPKPASVPLDPKNFYTRTFGPLRQATDPPERQPIQAPIDIRREQTMAELRETLREEELKRQPKKVYSELRGMFMAWQGLHHEMAELGTPGAAIYFMRHVTLNKSKFSANPPVYSDEPMEMGDNEEDEDEDEEYGDMD
ncbi:hypothetical protein B9Z55_003833 [Caenorhabditis nigoni]|uniref:B30.2/SPRY domain-containing protein n=1 Tax=Caenorhabditis nigoni TaxID=1611254 RepID=A0A2G5VS99_9PELO|nr:hypothetical protein B9Z55_003833 [Caenorhabditis nigoni]